MKKFEFFKIEGNNINRIRKHCPKCGPAVFLAEHKNRFSCGKCGYTEFKGSGKKPEKIQEKPITDSVKNQPTKEIETKEHTIESDKSNSTSSVEQDSNISEIEKDAQIEKNIVDKKE